MEYKRLDELQIEIIDGDRGKNYPNGDDFKKEKYCLFLNAKNVTINGFNFSETMFIDKDKDTILRKGKLNRDDIVLTTRGTVGNVAYYSSDIIYENVRINSGMVILRCDKNSILPEYLYYVLKSNFLQKQITNIKSGSAQPQLPISTLKTLKINFLKISLQKRVIKVLKAIDKKIELNNQINDNLQKLCNNYYLKLVDDKYEEVSLAELMDYQGGSQPPASEFQYCSSNDNIRFVQIRDFDTDSHMCYIPNSSKNKICQEDDILIARYGASLGRICYGLYGAYNVALAKVLPKKSNYKEIIRIVLESKDFFEYINSVGQRSAQAGFNAGDIQAFKVKIPNDNNKIIKYNDFARECLNKRLLNNKENKRLEQLRDTLLPKLMNGEIDLDKIEI